MELLRLKRLVLVWQISLVPPVDGEDARKRKYRVTGTLADTSFTK